MTVTFLERLQARKLPPEPPQRGRPRSITAIAQPGHNPRYVDAAILAELNRLAATTEGTRNQTLIAVACNVFEFVKGGHANKNACRAELEFIATAIGLTDHEIQATLRSAWDRVKPRAVPAPGSAAPA
jgi:hypothetical protein